MQYPKELETYEMSKQDIIDMERGFKLAWSDVRLKNVSMCGALDYGWYNVRHGMEISRQFWLGYLLLALAVQPDHSIGFNRRNRGTAKCDHCGKVTWADRIEFGYCERCNVIFGYDNAMADSTPGSDEWNRARLNVERALKMRGYPEFPDRGVYNSEETRKLVKAYKEGRL